MSMFTPTQRLSNAIVWQAAKDYRLALSENNIGRITECERFFRSEWYEFLTDVDGEFLIEKLRKEIV